MMNAASRTLLALAAAGLALLVAGCSTPLTQGPDYKSSSARAPSQALEVPPGLSTPGVEDRFAIPDPKAQTSFSTYNREKGATPASPNLGVLPTIESARIERRGDQRWLVVKGEPNAVWTPVRNFWVESGFVLLRESPEIGIMETDWAENRAKVEQDIIRRSLGKVIDQLWSTSERDRFRTRLEKGLEPGTTEVFVSHRGLEEVYSSNFKDHTVWQPRPADRELEAEMLSRILVKLGFGEKKPATGTATAPASGSPASGAAEMAPRNAVLENSGNGPLVVNDSFDRAWRRVGLALDRVGFTVEDRDRSKGVFFVRYVDPEADLKDTGKKGWLDTLAFWKPAPKSAQPQYRIQVAEAGTSQARIEVQNMQGATEKSPTGKKILTLLYDELK